MAWSEAQTVEVLQALAVTCEVTGTTYSEPARRLILDELQRYEVERVLTSLRMCARECKGKLSLGEIVERMERVDRKALSDQRAARSHYLTQLRVLALSASVPWEMGEEKVRAALEQKGYRLAPLPEKPMLQTFNPPHWQDQDP